MKWFDQPSWVFSFLSSRHAMPVTSLWWAPLSPQAKPSQALVALLLGPRTSLMHTVTSVTLLGWQGHLAAPPAPLCRTILRLLQAGDPIWEPSFSTQKFKCSASQNLTACTKAVWLALLVSVSPPTQQTKDLPSFLCDHYLNCIVSI